MNSSQAYFYKPNSSKIKLTNVYPYDSFRPGGINEFTNRGKSSLSPKKMITHKDLFNKNRRTNSHQNNFNCYNFPYKFNDIDKLVEEVTNFKLEMNKKNKEIHNLKIAFAKLDEENKRNIHIIEEVIIEANKHRKNNGDAFKFDPENLVNEIHNCLAYSVTSDKLLAKLLESHAINNLKRQIFEYKNILANKDEELANFKANARISKFQEIDGKLKKTIEELIHLKENYSILMNIFNQKDTKLREVMEEKDNHKLQNQKLKFQNEEFKERLLSFQDANSKMSEQIKFLEEKNSNFKYQISTYKTQLKEKEIEIAKLKSDLKTLENYKTEKDKHEKTFKNLNANITNLKEDLERKSSRLRELQRINNDLKQKIENAESNKNKDLESRNKDSKNKDILAKEFEETVENNNNNNNNKDKVIKNLEGENVKLRKEIIKLNDELINKADNQLADIEREFNNKNTHDNLQSEINNLILENKKDEISQFERNLAKELLSQEDLESENKFSDILKPLNIMENKEKALNRSLSSHNRLQAQISLNRTNSHKNIDNQRYCDEPENDEVSENNVKELENNFDDKKAQKENEENLKHSINNSLNKEENNFNFSDLKNKNDFEEDSANINESYKEYKKEEIKLNRIKRPENSKKKLEENNKEKMKQMLIEEENRNLNSSCENNNKSNLQKDELDACDEYLKEHEYLYKSEEETDNNEKSNKNLDLQDNKILSNKAHKDFEDDKNLDDINENYYDNNFEEDYDKKRINIKTPSLRDQDDLECEIKYNAKVEKYDKKMSNENDDNYQNYENEDDNKYNDFTSDKDINIE